MKSIYFSGLIFCSFFLAAAQTNGQSTEHSHLLAYQHNDNVNRDVILLRWSTKDEGNVDRYVIEKSTDSMLFNPMHEVVPQVVLDEVGDSAYQDEDPYPSVPTNYYRLATILKDGSIIYTPVVRVDVNNAQTPSLKPSLLSVNGMLRIDNFYQQPLIVQFYNEGGTFIASYTASNSTFYMNNSNLSQGVVVYRILDEHHAFLNAGKIMLQ